MNMLYRTTDAVEVVSAGCAEVAGEFGPATEKVQGPEALDRLSAALLLDLDAPVLEQIARLRTAQEIVRSEMARLGRMPSLDRLALGQLGASIHDLADQAEILILAMVKRGGAEVLVNLVDEIFDSLRDAERLIEIALRRGRPMSA